MNLSELIAYLESLVDYDPVNETYRAQIVKFFHAAQVELLGAHPWDFIQRDDDINIQTDVTYSLGFTAGSASVSGSSFEIDTSTTTPGSPLELATMEVTDSDGLVGTYTIMFVAASNVLYIDRGFEGATGTYDVTVRWRTTYLPPHTAQIQGVRNPALGIPSSTDFLAKITRDEAGLDPATLGTTSRWLAGPGLSVPAPRKPYGVTVTTGGSGKGERTITVYMVNVYAPNYWGYSTYPGTSGGLESGLSAGVEYTLADDEEITVQGTTLDGSTGLYRRWYFTCPDEGIYAPRRIYDDGTGNAGQNTLKPTDGSTVITADTSLTYLQSQALEVIPRYQRDMPGTFQSILLYPHPSADQAMMVRRVMVPTRMEDDTDTTMIPAAYAHILALRVAEMVALKAGSKALAQSYQEERIMLMRRMEATYQGHPSRRIVKGGMDDLRGRWYGPVTYLGPT